MPLRLIAKRCCASFASGQNMNKIKGKLDKSDYAIYDDFINFRIDDYCWTKKLMSCTLDKVTRD
jgi:hypothetical protein